MSHRYRVLITGATGLLGTPTTRLFRADPNYEVSTPDLDIFDITNESQVVKHFTQVKPDIVINCAAYTRVDDCETNIDLAMHVNGEGAGFVAREAARIGARMIHISTDYVFDGLATSPYTEDAPTGNPAILGIYARSKLQGEKLVREYHPKALIARTAWLFGADGPCFPTTILKLAAKGESLRIVNDQHGCPTYAGDLAQALYTLAPLDTSGVVHIVNAGPCSWFDFAKEILSLRGITTPVIPIPTSEFPRPAKRPAYSVLDTSRYAQLTGAKMRPWKEALAEFLK